MTKPANPLFGRLVQALWLALRRFGRKNGPVMSSHVAMSLMMALFPFVLFTVALAGSLSQGYVTDELIELIFGAWPKDVADPIVAELRAVLAGSGTGVITLGGLLAIYFASNGVAAVRAAMNQAYHDQDSWPFWKTRLLCLVLVILGGAAILVIAAVEVILPVYTNLVAEHTDVAVTQWFSVDRLRWTFTVGVPAGTVLLAHLILPTRRHKLSQILPGVVLTLALWTAGGWAFSIYISQFATYSATYAGLAGAMAALIFLYLCSAMLILGAEYNGALMDLNNAADGDKA
ncbi:MULTISPECIES: YihY/virulence factor BrkB family protein [unclassified Ruegeria]|uniref:YihY/virulence factor BrkB family protein n=1 Tax=unclassified Ruegeria TaxID=2625375 RepID=UPI0014882A60|nr:MULTISPECIES: YihY/virulence factor BrkB family protein [unclassified Ruegeria]NOD75349.1 YihY family inner membrane protein [Ruegeria sp. HKCCD4332]NOD87310.1 YihY family inner membrane protein [Ruegeria sp. HKCCD4318]NOD91421.1 YihY family inner membrane protein [Ruegeria sp. HKCCD4884]NOE12865.1 YihY family inner membrane protein [Ruegeria sp. HKCCD4318-2]NOG08968.1 YihY/virulence factor BrkB family protein [Ruegeria sp. HKCCD4315]